MRHVVQHALSLVALFSFPLTLLLAEPSGAKLKSHPDAVANTHAPGEVDNPALVPFIVEDPTKLPGIVVDETSATLVGKWQYSTHTPPYVGLGYLHDQKEDKGKKSVTFTPELPRDGRYEVRLSHCYNVRRSTNTPVAIHHADGETIVRINQQDIPPHGKLFRSLGTFRFKAGREGWVKISTDGTDGKYVIADAVQWIAEEPPKPSFRLSAEMRERCLAILRAGLKSDEFWPSMHAAEALTLAGFGAEVRTALEPLLASEKDAQHRCGLAREMVRAGDARKVSVLLETLAEPDIYGHTHAAESLFKVGQMGDGALLQKTMRETRDAKRQLMAAAALAKSGNRDALALVRQKLSDENPEARKIAAWILIRLGDAFDLPLLRKNLARDNTPVDRAYIIYALASLGDAAGLAELEKNYQHENVEIRTFAAEFTSLCRAVHLAEKLTALLDDSVLDVRVRAAQSLLVLSLPAKE